MAKVELVMPKMGESIIEATILKWHKQVGDTVDADETILEVATDKVDTEIPAPASGVVTEILFEEDSVVEIGKVIAIISTEGEAPAPANPAPKKETPAPSNTPAPQPVATPIVAQTTTTPVGDDDRFYSPLVKNIAKEEGINTQELAQIPGSGKDGRVTKSDILNYLQNRASQPSAPASQVAAPAAPVAPAPAKAAKSMPAPTIINDGNTEIIQMDRMRKLIADHMVNSLQTSPHVTSFVEADVTNIVNWRNRVKKEFQKKYGEKITFTPIFMEAVAKAIKDFPMINVSVDGDKIIRKKSINIGMAAALPTGNLIVPVIKNADHLNLLGLTKQVNDLAKRARNNQLKADEIQGGTYTLTNVGTFGNIMGTPIINQPQVAILAVGSIVKKPAVIETEHGDVIAIRHKMYLSHSYDHRVVDGFLGGSFVKRVGEYLEAFDDKQEI